MGILFPNQNRKTMKSTREKVLQTLISNPRSTILEIAKDVGINAISVRHHLTSLQAASLVSAEEYKPAFETLKFEEKLALLKTVMAKEGYELTLSKSGDKYQLNEVSCPFYQIGREHPEICLFDKTLIAKLLSIPEEQIEH